MKNNSIQLTPESLKSGFESMFKEVNTFRGKSGEGFRNCIATAANGMLTDLELTGEVTDTQSLITRHKNLQIVAAATEKISDGDHVFYNGLYKWLLPFSGAGRASGQERVAFISMIKTIIINEINKVAEVINNKLIALDDTVKTKDRITEQLVAQNHEMQAHNQQIIETHQQEKAQIAEMATLVTNELHLTHEQLKQMDQKVEEKETQLKEKDATIARFDEQFKNLREENQKIKNVLDAYNSEMKNQSKFFSNLQDQNMELLNQTMNQSKIMDGEIKNILKKIQENDNAEMKEMLKTIMSAMMGGSMVSSRTSMKSSKHSKYNTNNKADQEKILSGLKLVKSQEVDLNKLNNEGNEFSNDNRSSNYTDMLKKQEEQRIGDSNISIIE